LVSRIFSHLNASSSDYSWIVGAWLRLHSEELLEEYPVGFDPHKGFAEMDKDGNMEYSVGIEIPVLDAVVPK
jgi:hypothetical protein